MRSLISRFVVLAISSLTLGLSSCKSSMPTAVMADSPPGSLPLPPQGIVSVQIDGEAQKVRFIGQGSIGAVYEIVGSNPRSVLKLALKGRDDYFWEERDFYTDVMAKVRNSSDPSVAALAAFVPGAKESVVGYTDASWQRVEETGLIKPYIDGADLAASDGHHAAVATQLDELYASLKSTFLAGFHIWDVSDANIKVDSSGGVRVIDAGGDSVHLQDGSRLDYWFYECASWAWCNERRNRDPDLATTIANAKAAASDNSDGADMSSEDDAFRATGTDAKPSASGRQAAR